MKGHSGFLHFGNLERESRLQSCMLIYMLTAGLNAVWVFLRVFGWFIPEFSVQVKTQFWVIDIHVLSEAWSTRTLSHQINTLYNLYATENF